MPHMLHCALVQALGTQLDASKCSNNDTRALITTMRSVVRHVNSSTIISKTFASWQQEYADREMEEAESTRPDQISARQLDQQILRRRKQNLKQDVSQRLESGMLYPGTRLQATDAGDACEQVGEHDLDVHECSAELECAHRRLTGRLF